MITRIREKGQITIPVNIRQALHLTENSVLSVTKVGDGILLMPGPSVLDAVAEKYSRAAEAKGITLDGLLKDLKKTRSKKK